jgi:hypothetical protein
MDSLRCAKLKVRLEIVYFLSITNCMNEAMFSFVPKLKPNLPALIPKMGIPESRTVAALEWFRHHLY